MTEFSRLKNRLLAKLFTRFPMLAKVSIRSYHPVESRQIPWTTMRKPLSNCTVALITTAGVHRKDQTPFDMKDPNGDPSFRIIGASKPLADLIITHDYYDHRDADRDMNIVFPIERLRDFEQEGIIRRVADINYGFMGHIVGPHIETLIHGTAPEVAGRLAAGGADVVILVPG